MSGGEEKREREGSPLAWGDASSATGEEEEEEVLISEFRRANCGVMVCSVQWMGVSLDSKWRRVNYITSFLSSFIHECESLRRRLIIHLHHVKVHSSHPYIDLCKAPCRGQRSM